MVEALLSYLFLTLEKLIFTYLTFKFSFWWRTPFGGGSVHMHTLHQAFTNCCPGIFIVQFFARGDRLAGFLPFSDCSSMEELNKKIESAVKERVD